ncbi:ATP-dependent RNA helicase DHX8 (DEAH box protein 8) (RNA helicase HRH1) [Durusdinium trenchii]|uniref:RNA helicase n=1 Tax=Durusdinium trenchii TaxID=1381693 RepID=A0ABP0LUT1_9DINO
MGSGDAKMSGGERRPRELPVFAAEELLVRECARHGTVIVVGETGSGKSTQIPQFLMERRTFGGRVAVTQPRRVAAVSLAKRVAWERRTKVGGLVGYNVRFDDCTGKKTRLRYLTDGMLLREAMLDSTLKRYSVVLLDEAHERSLSTDLLFGVVKRAQQERRATNMPLRVVVMSATLDVQLFMRYFSSSDKTGDAFDEPVAVHIRGRQFPVELRYATESQQDYLDAAIVTVLQVHLSERENKGDVLVFLTGQEEIESCAELLEEKAQLLPPNALKLQVCPLFAALPAHKQLAVFAPAPPGSRKVVLATNIAETSITISGVRFVVDTGMVKAKSYAASTGLELLRVGPISQEQAWQRAGRAGREGPGKCFRLYREQDFLKLRQRSVPEIKRVELSQVVLQLLTMGVRQVDKFPFIEAPPTDALRQAVFQLVALGAVSVPSRHASAAKKSDGGDAPQGPELTELGRRMAALPLEPMHAKFLIESERFGCTEEALTIAAMLSVESPLFTPRNARREANSAHRRYLSFEADHLTLLNVFGAFLEAKADAKWCQANFLKFSTLHKARKVRQQLVGMLSTVLETSALGSAKADSTPILQCLVSSFSLRIAQRLPPDGKPGVRYKTFAESLETRIHPSSGLARRDPPPEWVVYNELVMTSKKYLKGVAAIDQKWLVQFAPALFQAQAQAQARGGKTGGEALAAGPKRKPKENDAAQAARVDVRLTPFHPPLNEF